MIKPCDPRMYVILREDLAYKYIQGAHALAGFALRYPQAFKEWKNQYLINLSVFNGLALEQIEVDLKMKRLEVVDKYKEEEGQVMTPFTVWDYTTFYEPDLKSELPTAICIFENGEGFVSDFLSSLKLATK